MKNLKNITKIGKFIILSITLFYCITFNSNVYASEVNNIVLEVLSNDYITEENEEITLKNEEEFEKNIDEDIANDSDNNEQIEDEEVDTDINDNFDDSNSNDSDVEINDDMVETITKEEIFSSNSIDMNFNENMVVIKGNILESITVKEVLDRINIVALNDLYLLEKVGITNEDDIWLEDVDYVTNLCHIVFIGNEFVSRYKVVFLGDLNSDNIVNEDDVKTGIDNFFEETIIDTPVIDTPIIEEEETTIIESNDITEEISYVDAVVKNNTYEVPTPTLEEETLNVSINKTDEIENITPEDKVIVEVKIDGFVSNYLNTISGKINYNNEILELENVYVLIDNKVLGKSLDNKFIYVLDNYQDNNTFMVIVFKAIGYGVTDVSLEQLKLVMNGTPLSILNNDKLSITVNESSKGGDVELPSTNNKPNIEQSKPPVTNVSKPTTKPQKKPSKLNEVVIDNTTNNIVTLSNDNYIKNMDIVGYEILFDKEINNYFIEVENTVNALTLNVSLNSDKASYLITGNENFKVGKNEVILTVLAEDGSSRDYVIKVNKKEAVVKDLDNESNKSEKQENDKIESNKNKKKNNNIFSNIKISYEVIILVILIISIMIMIYKLLKKED